MLRRKILDDLISWKNRPGHKCLLLRGQRQVGKTFILREFAKTYDSSAYIDFSDNVSFASEFDTDLNVDRIVRSLEVMHPGLKLVPGKSLIVFDEIQTCPRARLALKQFTIDGRYDVVASGSLLDVRMPDTDPTTSFVPVGYEEHMRMYGLDFEEFLWGKGYDGETISWIKSAIIEKRPLPDTVLRTMENAFREYAVIGGMPEVVQAFVNKASITEIRSIQDNILIATRNDMVKFSRGSDTLKIMKCFNSIPSQLADSNKKFMYSRIEGDMSRSGARKFGDSLLWIEGAGIGNMCYQLNGLDNSASVSQNRSQFKIYMSDTGLLIRMMDGKGNVALSAVLKGDNGFNQGAIMENVIAECLMKSGMQPCFYIKRNGPDMMELDLVIDLGSELAAIEIKSGKDRFAPSLRKTLVSKGSVKRRIVFENSNISVDEDGIEHYPLFAGAFISCMASSEIPEFPGD